jgi:hypothetical protein
MSDKKHQTPAARQARDINRANRTLAVHFPDMAFHLTKSGCYIRR